MLARVLLSGGTATAQEQLTPDQVREQQAFAIGTLAYIWG